MCFVETDDINISDSADEALMKN